ncbi:MAG TPA: hypoxanthine phosphoribosyltransferase [Puia sp.]|nr:hypoxanthine phosphoribosyltransferase [Puia sp.]
MSGIRIHDKFFKPYLSQASISEKVREMAEQINQDYKGKKPLFISILNGSFMFASDLFKELTMEVEICFIKLASYKGIKSSGQVVTAIGLDMDIFGRHVLIVEDIVDTGKTLNQFLPQLQHQQPASLKIVSLLYKPDAKIYPIAVDYLGFSIPNKFVVGYGLDYNGLGRNMREIYQLAE